MYQEFYGLKEKPFSLTPDPQFLYLSESHQTALESLLFGIHQREGFMVITGDIGTGKTTISRALLGKLDNSVKTAVIFNSMISEGKLLESILKEFGVHSKARTTHERIQSLNQFLLELLPREENAVLIIDEAQNLSIPLLEQIRMLSNLETEKEKMLQIILLGQLELDKKLHTAELRQLNQRVSIRHHLLSLTRKEMESYIYQRLMVAGAQGRITFSKSALEQIFKFSNGTPRLINLLCDRSLLGGFVEETYHIDRKIVKAAKSTLLGEEGQYTPSRFSIFLRLLTPSRVILLLIFSLLLMVMTLFSLNHFSSVQTGRSFMWGSIEDIRKQTPRVTGASYLPLSEKPIEHPHEGETPSKDLTKESKGPSQEGSL